jgi:serine/threonine-protein kinase RsbW
MVEIRLPADGAYLALLRTATAGLAARLDFTLDEIEDLRIAVDEACALLLVDAAHDSPLECRFTLNADILHVEVSVRSSSGALPDQTSFAWTVLEALAGSVDLIQDGDTVRISLHKQREARG